VTRIVVTGATGQVGWELARCLLPLGEVLTPTRRDFDLADTARLREYLRAMQPDVIVNPAAYTAVDQAEREPDLAMAVNGLAPAVMAEEAQRLGAILVHYSTDYVFDGAGSGAYVESDPTAPQGAYGRTKLAGEQAVCESGADHLVFRTSWVYASRGKNFLRTILRLAAEREELRIVADQVGAPTWARLIAEATMLALRQAMGERAEGRFASGLYHLTAQGATSWHGFASRIVDMATRMPGAKPVRVQRIEPITTAEYPLPARRPANSCMSCEAFMHRFGLDLPDWERCLLLAMEEVAEASR
jgi:dTDP-4-dehydrorhamnose reductase